MLINKLIEEPTNSCKHICNSHKPKNKPKIAKELPLHRLKKEFHFFPNAKNNVLHSRHDNDTENTILTMVCKDGGQEPLAITAPTQKWRFCG
jgi:hypothetical protein